MASRRDRRDRVIQSRGGRDLAARFLEVAAAVAELGDVVVDGELLALTGKPPRTLASTVTGLFGRGGRILYRPVCPDMVVEVDSPTVSDRLPPSARASPLPFPFLGVVRGARRSCRVACRNW
ncbi:hypothetical protein CLV68_5968 [Actinokineospora cianjurensis]|uniref:Uncharacterized protein n=1 Tax=Actinokineospora cianjurensis TaxID=585224 RepID=A0A421AX94_9PSEU|nr:hypothetical protein CLV68_5968 [Actinokineospora cianjurensis]